MAGSANRLIFDESQHKLYPATRKDAFNPDSGKDPNETSQQLLSAGDRS